MPIIKDPKMNQDKEANFGVLFDDSDKKEVYYLYYKGDLVVGNPKRYFIAGTEVAIASGPLDLNIKNYKYRDGIVNENIKEWVEINSTPGAGTGPVTAGDIQVDHTAGA